VLSLPETQRLSFVAGYLDTDGCAAQGKRGFSLKSVNRQLLCDVAHVLTSLGITSRLFTENEGERDVAIVGRPATSRGAHRLDFPADARLLWYVSRGLQNAADRQVPAQLAHHRTVGRSNIVLPEAVEVRKVEVSEPLEVVPTWDIEVEGTGNFVSQGFIVHNSKVTMKYPAVWMVGEHAKGETLSVAFAGEGQHQDAGAKMVHAAPYTSSTIISKSVARGGGRTSYRGLVQVQPGAHHSKSTVKCDALLVDAISRSDTYPYVDVREDDVQMGHEATVSKVSEEQLFYLMSRGMSEDEAMAMIVRGFVEPIARELPMEYALELNRLIELQMEGSVG
jgi:Fe-S cluster assembly scaffold protein SufB